jgi:hypothetical protein
MNEPKGAIAIGSLPGMRELINVMTQPKEQLIEKIEKSLALFDELIPNQNSLEVAGDYLELHAVEISRLCIKLRKENKKLEWSFKSSNKKRDSVLTNTIAQLQQTREELERAHEASRIQSKAYMKLEDLHRSLRTELSAKDKVLEWYGNAENYTYQFYYGEDESEPDELEEPIMADDGIQARTILQQYKGEATDASK